MGTALSVEETEALERLLREWEVRRVDCTPMERVGFYRLTKKGKVRIHKGTYLMPSNLTNEEFDAWFIWIEDVLGITPRQRPVKVRSRYPNTQGNTNDHIAEDVERD